jgi:FkbM family methyltransferase
MIDWFKDDGDNTLRINYNLNEDSLVVDLGGYHGDFSQKIYDKYHCNIICVEPCKFFYNKIKERFINVDKIKTYNVGIGALSETKSLYCNADATSFYSKVSDQFELSEIMSFNSFVSDIKQIDLLKINIEGGEYDLLDHIVHHDLQKKIINIQVQFHKLVEDYESRRKNIQDSLKKTHKLTYNYDFVWENWEFV